MTHRTAGKPEGPNPFAALVSSWWQAFVGALADCERMVASDRARRLHACTDWLATGGKWLAWAWVLAFAFYVAVTPLEVGQIERADEALMAREALFYVFGIALVGPVAVGLAVLTIVFVLRLASAAVAKQLPRAFSRLAPSAVALTALAALWPHRPHLHDAFWRLYYTVADVFAAARAFTPVI